MPPSANQPSLEFFNGILDEVERTISTAAAQETPESRGPIIHRHVVHQHEPRFARKEPPLDAIVREQLGVERLWCHQGEAIESLLEGTSTILTSRTASGKSVVAWAAIGQVCAGPRPATALILHPTKALGHDQFRHLERLNLPNVTAGVYDGDATETERAWVRRHANVIFTNPDMLHVGILPRHAQWATFLRRLRYVVVDEAHTLRGIFGSHVAHVLRRLRRQCAELASEPTFLFTSATIGDGHQHARALSGINNVHWVHNDGSPRGDRLIAQVDPPLTNPQTGARMSSHLVTALLAAALINQGQRTIVFCRSRRSTETITAAIKRQVDAESARRVQAYRAGYLADERRSIETDLANGNLVGVVATNALELGIDIGGLDACVLHGFPGTMASFRQQIGRVGRQNNASIAVLVSGTDQLDQYLFSHPDELQSRPVEPVVINPSNPQVLDSQIQCAAAESPLVLADEQYWGEDLSEGIRRCVQRDELRIQRFTTAHSAQEPRAVFAGNGHPASRISLRSGSGRELQIRDAGGTLVGTVDAARAAATLFPGATYLHRTEPFRVCSLDFATSTAVIEPDDGSTMTRADASTEMDVIDVETRRTLGPVEVLLGNVAVRHVVTGYSRIEVTTSKVIERVPLILPPETLVTRAVFLALPEPFVRDAHVSAEALPGALHALEHAMIAMLPLFAICDRWDVGGISTPWHADVSGAAIAIYDGYPGGAGIAELGFATIEAHLKATFAMLVQCPCATGCPSCVQSPKCGNGNEPLNKNGAIDLLSCIFDKHG